MMELSEQSRPTGRDDNGQGGARGTGHGARDGHAQGHQRRGGWADRRRTSSDSRRFTMGADSTRKRWTYPGSFGTSGFGGPPSGRLACKLGGRDAYAVVNGWATKRSKYERLALGGKGGAGGMLGEGAAAAADARRGSVI